MDNEMVLENNVLPPKFDHLPTFKRWLMSVLSKIHHGTLFVHLDGRCYACGNGDKMTAILKIHKPLKIAWNVITKGDLGFAESFLAGHWSSDDVTKSLTLLLKNSSRLGEAYRGKKFLLLTVNFYHKLHKNSLRGSRKNIQYHYDLGNSFYRLWLDESMTYSSALFTRESTQQECSLITAQDNKYQRILDELEVTPKQSVLEIGFGWGGFAEKALQKGCTLHGVTLSDEQLNYAQKRLKSYGDNAMLEIKDYRLLDQQYDHIVSIEMFEAVGKEYWSTYFEMLKRSLSPSGKIVLQIITIDDQYFESYQRQADFIQRYIFPGGMLPSEKVLSSLATENNLKIINKINFGQDYSETLARWESQFLKVQAELEEQGYDKRFQRMWHYYLAYCQAGFTEGRIDVVQITLTHDTVQP